MIKRYQSLIYVRCLTSDCGPNLCEIKTKKYFTSCFFTSDYVKFAYSTLVKAAKYKLNKIYRFILLKYNLKCPQLI